MPVQPQSITHTLYTISLFQIVLQSYQSSTLGICHSPFSFLDANILTTSTYTLENHAFNLPLLYSVIRRILKFSRFSNIQTCLLFKFTNSISLVLFPDVQVSLPQFTIYFECTLFCMVGGLGTTNYLHSSPF